MKSLPLVNLRGERQTACDMPSYTAAKYGASIGGCCGAQLVTDVAIDEGNWGITIAINDQPTKLVSDDKATYEAVQVGDIFINLKLRQV